MSKQINIGTERTCDCPPQHLCCLSAKEWLKNQIGVWEFAYEKRDVRDKSVHPASFPIGLPRRIIEQFTHEGELVLDPFAGIGSTLVAAQDAGRNAVGFDLSADYVDIAQRRASEPSMFANSQQVMVHDDALNIPEYLQPESVRLIVTSPPYANLLGTSRENKSYRKRKNKQYGKVEQYSQNPRDLGTMYVEAYTLAMGDIFESLLPLLRHQGHCVINVGNMWKDDTRINLDVNLIQEMEKRGYELRNRIIWDRRNIVNGTGIFGYPSNYITMGTTFEYILDFRKPER